MGFILHGLGKARGLFEQGCWVFWDYVVSVYIYNGRLVVLYLGFACYMGI